MNSLNDQRDEFIDKAISFICENGEKEDSICTEERIADDFYHSS